MDRARAIGGSSAPLVSVHPHPADHPSPPHHQHTHYAVISTPHSASILQIKACTCRKKRSNLALSACLTSELKPLTAPRSATTMRLCTGRSSCQPQLSHICHFPPNFIDICARSRSRESSSILWCATIWGRLPRDDTMEYTTTVYCHRDI